MYTNGTSHYSVCNGQRESEICVSTVLQRSLSNTEDECTHLKEMSERSQEELTELANKYNAAVNEIKELTDKIKVPAQRGHYWISLASEDVCCFTCIIFNKKSTV